MRRSYRGFLQEFHRCHQCLGHSHVFIPISGSSDSRNLIRRSSYTRVSTRWVAFSYNSLYHWKYFTPTFLVEIPSGNPLQYMGGYPHTCASTLSGLFSSPGITPIHNLMRKETVRSVSLSDEQHYLKELTDLLSRRGEPLISLVRLQHRALLPLRVGRRYLQGLSKTHWE